MPDVAPPSTPARSPADDAALAAAAFQAELDERRRAAVEAARAEVLAQLAPVTHQLEAMVRATSSWSQALRQRQLELLLEAVMTVLAAWMPATSEAWRDRLRPALHAWLTRTGEPGPVTVAVHPSELAKLRELLPELELTLEADPTITPGDLAVRGAHGAAEHRWRDALAALRPLVLELLEAGLPPIGEGGA
ncbi:MAG: FliH/SctL family protein [Kofleriaceae bacterium]